MGGLTGLPGSNQVYATVAATFNSFQPNVTQLGLLTVATTSASPIPDGRAHIDPSVQHGVGAGNQVWRRVHPGRSHQQPPVDRRADGFVRFRPWRLNQSNSQNPRIHQHGELAGADLAGQPGHHHAQHHRPDHGPDGGLSSRPHRLDRERHRPALIDVQGNIQSLRGISANGLVLNDTGYLNLIRTGQISNSTILAQPIGHVDTPMSHRTNTTLLSSNNRATGRRGGVALVSGLYQIGPLSLTNDSTTPPST